MSFLIDINPKMELPNYKLKLCKLNREPLASLKNIRDLKFSPLFVGINNLSFYVPFNIMKSDGENIKNPIYELVEGDHLVKLNDMDFYIITSVKEVADDNGKKYKEVVCKSEEYGLIDKKIIDYKASSRVLYDYSNEKVDGVEKGILNYIFNNITKAWTLGNVDPDLILRNGKGVYRALEFSNSNLIQVFSELQKTFNCIFTFNTVDKTIDATSVDNMLGEDRGLYISDNNFIKSITKDIQSDGIITRLYLRGKDNISIQSISPTGQPYLDNFQYYENTKYMSQGLINSLERYRKKIEEYNPNFLPLFNKLTIVNNEMETLLNADGNSLEDKGSIALKRELVRVQALIDVKVEELGIIQNSINNAEGVELSGLYSRKKRVQSALDELVLEKETINSYIDNKAEEITNKQNQINKIKANIKILQGNLSMSNGDNFTPEQLVELDKFIKVDTYSDSNYTEHNLEELRDEGIRQLDRLSQPKIQFEVSLVDFLNLVECQHIWKNFILGNIVTLEHKEVGIRFKVRLVGYTHDSENNSLNLQFSNTYTYDDDTLYERDLIESLENTSNAVNTNIDKWNDVGEIESRIAKEVNSKLEGAKQNILNAVGQNHLFGDDGLWLFKENPDGTIDDAQIRGINSDIVLTDDNWLSVKTAISAKDGINAELIRGKIGEFAELRATQIIAGNKGELIPEELVDGFPQVKEQINTIETDFKVTNEGIIERVTSVETDTTNLSSRVTDAEKKITPGAITSTVKESIQKGDIYVPEQDLISSIQQTANKVSLDFYKGLLTGASYTFDGENATFKGAGIKIQNELGENVLVGDTEGNLGIKGNIKMEGGSILWGNLDKNTKNGFNENALQSWINSGYATNITKDGIYTGFITANKILIGGENGFISFDDLSDKPTILDANDIKSTVITKDWIGTLGLSVGNEIKMGDNAKISWGNVTNKPDPYTNEKALQAWKNSGYATNITQDGLYTGTITANKILIGGDNGTISFDTLSDKPWIPKNAEDVNARPDDWVPTWGQIQEKPEILSADDIKSTVITKDWIGTLGLMVGDEIQMGSNARISWNNVINTPTIPDEQYITEITNDTISTSNLVSQTLLSELAYIKQLTTDKLETSTKINNYLISDISDVNYIRAEKSELEFITAKRLPSGTESVEDNNGNRLYWTDNSYKLITINRTDYPVKTYRYTEVTKMKIRFEEVNGVYTPIITLGQGDGVTAKSGTGEIFKGTDGLYLKYFQDNTGKEMNIKMDVNGIHTNYAEFNGNSNIRNIKVTTDTPNVSMGNVNDIILKVRA